MGQTLGYGGVSGVRRVVVSLANESAHPVETQICETVRHSVNQAAPSRCCRCSAAPCSVADSPVTRRVRATKTEGPTGICFCGMVDEVHVPAICTSAMPD